MEFPLFSSTNHKLEEVDLSTINYGSICVAKFNLQCNMQND